MFPISIALINNSTGIEMCEIEAKEQFTADELTVEQGFALHVSTCA